MKIFLLILIIITLGCASSQKEPETQPLTLVEHETQQLNDSLGESGYVNKLRSELAEKSLSRLDFSMFPENKVDTLDDLEWEHYKSLPPITEVYTYENNEGKYYADLTFTDKFKTFIISIFEGGDCGPALWLVNSRGDSTLSQKTIYQKCGWEYGNHAYTSIIKNDTTFLLTLEAEGTAIDSNGDYIPDSLTHRLKKELISITSKGRLTMSVTKDTTWTTLDID